MRKDINRRGFIKEAGKSAVAVATVATTGGVGMQAVRAQTENFGFVPFKQPPTVYIQDAMNDNAYLIPSKTIDTFSVTQETWSKIGKSTITFVIPDGSFVHPIPPFYQSPSESHSVLIQHPAIDRAYFLGNSQLKDFAVDDKIQKMCRDQKECGGKHMYDFSFILPIGMELIWELPAAMQALLQSQERSLEGRETH